MLLQLLEIFMVPIWKQKRIYHPEKKNKFCTVSSYLLLQWSDTISLWKWASLSIPQIHERLWSISGMILTWENQRTLSTRNPTQTWFVQEPRLLWWETSHS